METHRLSHEELHPTDTNWLEETEVMTRMVYILYKFRFFELEDLKWNEDFESHGLDSFAQTAILTSIEHEFHTVFEDRIFENFRTFADVKDHISKDHLCF